MPSRLHAVACKITAVRAVNMCAVLFCCSFAAVSRSSVGFCGFADSHPMRFRTKRQLSVALWRWHDTWSIPQPRMNGWTAAREAQTSRGRDGYDYRSILCYSLVCLFVRLFEAAPTTRPLQNVDVNAPVLFVLCYDVAFTFFTFPSSVQLLIVQSQFYC